MTTKMFKSVILGAPASGKGTISSRIVKAFNLVHISSGDKLRQNIQEKTRLCAMPKSSKSDKNKSNKDIIKMSDIEKKAEDAKGFIERFLGDVSKTSATKQILLGTTSGWVTGFLAMRVGKTAALALGGGIILLQVANEKGYIKINWDKVNKNLDKVADKVEEKISGEGPSWMDKAERFVDRKINQTEDGIRKQKRRAKNWYSSFMGDSDCKLHEIHIFVISFVAGVAIGVGTA